MKKKSLEKKFYLIAQYHLGELEGFIKIGDNKDEIIELFKNRYCWKPYTFGITEKSHQLLEVNAKEIMNDRFYLESQV
jgi:hypothetical protein